jgi:hypothetical protein
MMDSPVDLGSKKQQYSSQRNGGYLHGTMYHQEIYQPRILGGKKTSPRLAEIMIFSISNKHGDFYTSTSFWGCQ